MGISEKHRKFLKKLGLRLRGMRQAKGWTLEEAEEKGWPSWRHLQQIETGKNIMLTTLLQLSELYGVEPNELLKGV